MVWLTDARAPDGLRLYAIGDVHGCLDALRDAHRAIEADLVARPAPDWRIILLGDYVDRGPDSRGVIEYLVERSAAEPRMLCLRGNHDEMLLRGIGGDSRMREIWLANGGVEALESYGVTLPDYVEALRSHGAGEGILPAPHRAFLEGLRDSVRFGDYYFVHAGIHPERALEDQAPDAQLWIRGPFLDWEGEFEAVIVHGHTPRPNVEVRPNRIGIDTGAVFGGSLTCLVLEEDRKGLLTVEGVLPLPSPERGEEGEEAPDGDRPGIVGRMLRRFGWRR